MATTTAYVGDLVRLTDNAVTIDGATPIVPGIVSAITIQIFSSSGIQVLSEKNMSYLPGQKYWYYDWYPAGPIADTYTVECSVYSTDATPERIKRDYLILVVQADQTPS